MHDNRDQFRHAWGSPERNAVIERAKRMTLDEKFREGLDLFDQYCDRRNREIRAANPEFSDAEARGVERGNR